MNAFATANGSRRDYLAEQRASAPAQFPVAVILSCIDSRAPAEVVMDLGIANVFNARVAGNISNEDILGSMEFACKAAGAKVVLVMGHTACGAIQGAIDNVELGNLTGLLAKIRPAVKATEFKGDRSSKNPDYVDAVARKNVELTMAQILEKSPVLRDSSRSGPSKWPGRCTISQRRRSNSSAEPERPGEPFEDLAHCDILAVLAVVLATAALIVSLIAGVGVWIVKEPAETARPMSSSASIAPFTLLIRGLIKSRKVSPPPPNGWTASKKNRRRLPNNPKRAARRGGSWHGLFSNESHPNLATPMRNSMPSPKRRLSSIACSRMSAAFRFFPRLGLKSAIYPRSPAVFLKSNHPPGN